MSVRELPLLAPLRFEAGVLEMMDQRLLPGEEQWLQFRDVESTAQAIETMVVRGAPAIGCAAAYGVALGALEAAKQGSSVREAVAAAKERLARTRPTAVNLFWALEHMAALPLPDDGEGAAKVLVAEAEKIQAEDIESCRAIGRHGAALMPEAKVRIHTHCNAGALATGGYGTALGVVRAAWESGREVRVVADETRPVLQGSRLTAWELMRDGIDVTLIPDNMAAHIMRRGDVDVVVVGADRIVRNGDVANKIGTYPLALMAKAHGIPFYVAAPLSTLDMKLQTGAEIPIEERKREEVTHVGPTAIAPLEVGVRNYAFDVTPNDLVAAIITEKGVARAPYDQSLPALFE